MITIKGEEVCDKGILRPFCKEKKGLPFPKNKAVIENEQG